MKEQAARAERRPKVSYYSAMSKRPRPSPPLYLLRLPNLLSHADIARLERITKDTTYSTAYEAPALWLPRGETYYVSSSAT